MILELLSLQIKQKINSQKLGRTPEPMAVSDGLEQSSQYSRSIKSIMIVPYITALNFIDKLLPHHKRTKVLELCCGPGNFTNLLAGAGSFKKVTAVDLSGRMLAQAKNKFSSEELKNVVEFIQDDVTQLSQVKEKKFDLVTFMNGAHHLDSLYDVHQVLFRSHELAGKDGTVFVMDPVRPKTQEIADQYVTLFGKDYLNKDLPHFYQDFKDSVSASWTDREFISAIPKDTGRTWIHILPFGYPAFQFVIGLPSEQSDIVLNKDSLNHFLLENLPPEYTTDYQLLKLSIYLGKKTIVK